MGSPSALCVVLIPGVAALNSLNFPNSPNSPNSRLSLDGSGRGGHGCPASAAPRMLAMMNECRVLAASSSRRPWRMPLLSGSRIVMVRAESSGGGDKGQVKTEDVPGWAKPDSGELPPWAKNERPASQEPAQDLPFAVYLLISAIVAIAATGSVFEYFNQNPVFGVVFPDNPLYIPILGFFSITGFPAAGFLFYKSIQLANKASEEADKEDGFPR